VMRASLAPPRELSTGRRWGCTAMRDRGESEASRACLNTGETRAKTRRWMEDEQRGAVRRDRPYTVNRRRGGCIHA